MTKRAFGVVTFFLLMGARAGATDYKRISDVLAAALPTFALGATLYLDDKQGQWDFAYALGANLVTTFGIKYAVDKKRPDGGRHGFPSGHTSVAFHSAAFVHKRYGLTYAAPMYATAALVGYARVRAKRHFVSDVLAGAAIGTLFGYLMTEEYHGIAITPGTSKTSLGVTLSKRW